MATWQEQRAILEVLSVDLATRAAIDAALARLDAAERVVEKSRLGSSFLTARERDAYDALVREQDGGR